jgi:hypothetical protein
MFKNAMRLGVLVMLVAAFLYNTPGGAKAAPVGSILPGAYGDIYGVPWNGNLDSSTWDTSNLTHLSFQTSATTFGELQTEFESRLGYRTVLLAQTPLFPVFAFTGAGLSLSALAIISFPVTYIKPDPSDLLTKYFPFGAYHVAIFKAPHKTTEIPRLTLYGFVSGDNHTCVLWSLNGALPNNVNKACGMDVKPVCTVKLIEKKLEYECKSGYNWLGEQIVHDPQWLSWADKFASMNGHR